MNCDIKKVVGNLVWFKGRENTAEGLVEILSIHKKLNASLKVNKWMKGKIIKMYDSTPTNWLIGFVNWSNRPLDGMNN